jgi:hypothetical protein
MKYVAAALCSFLFSVTTLVAQEQPGNPPEVIVIGHGSSRYQTSFNNSADVVKESYKLHSCPVLDRVYTSYETSEEMWEDETSKCQVLKSVYTIVLFKGEREREIRNVDNSQ